MHWNQTNNTQRLENWKEFRTKITELAEDSALEELAKFAAVIPFGSRTLDYYDPISWPTPWEILYANSQCTSSISLLIYYTALLSKPLIDANLVLVNDHRDQYLLLQVNGDKILNFYPNEVSPIEDLNGQFEVIRTYTKQEVKSIY